MNRRAFPYACECPDRSCRRRVVLLHREYLARAAVGPVVAGDCPTRLRRVYDGSEWVLIDWLDGPSLMDDLIASIPPAVRGARAHGPTGQVTADEEAGGRAATGTAASVRAPLHARAAA